MSLFLFLSLSRAEDNRSEFQAKHGGIVQKTANTFLEIVQDKEKTNIYITGHDHKNISDKRLSLSAIAHVNGKEYPMQLSLENDHYSVSPSNSYLHKEKNYVLMINISFSGTVDRASFHLRGR
jgi:hypothetical protein